MNLKQLNTFFLRCQVLVIERHNPHDDLCLTDTPVISFDGESPLNARPYSSDEFNDKINRETVLRIIPNRVDDTGVAERAYDHLIFCVTKKGSKGEKERISKQKL